MASQFRVLCLSLPLAWAGQQAPDELVSAALADDDQCDGQADGNCSLTMLQLRGTQGASEEQAATTIQQEGGTIQQDEEWKGSCKVYGCSHHYRKYRRCQCNSGCEGYSNCCDDYEERCKKSAPTPSPPGGGGAAGGQPVGGHPKPGKTYPEYPGFTLALVEEFDEPIDLDTDPVWTWSDGGLAEGQIRFVKEAITFPKGKMRITVSKDKKYHSQNCSNAEVDEIEAKDMTSGEMRTKHNMFRYGRYEARIRAPKVQPGNTLVNGNYISTMFVFRDAKYKHWREIDIELTGDHPDSITTNVLSADNTAKWKASIAESKGIRVKKNLRQDFHTIAFEWTPDRIAWYFEGKLIREKTGGHVPIPDLAGKIMMNLWMFDERALFGGKEIWNNYYPMYSEYDWFRFYKWDEETTYPCPDFSTSCLTADDQYLSSNNPCDGIPQVGTVYGKEPCKATCQQGSKPGSPSPSKPPWEGNPAWWR